MIHIKTYLTIKLITWWSYMSTIYTSIYNKCYNIYNYLEDFFYGYNDMWLFIPGHTYPLSLNNLSNDITANWIYNNHNNTFTNCIEENRCNYKLSWLSAKICIRNVDIPNEITEYSIDDFIEKIIICTTSTSILSLYHVFLCWCIYTKHWFKFTDDVKFHIIDDTGTEYILNFNEHNNYLFIKNNKIYAFNNTICVDSVASVTNITTIVEQSVKKSSLITDNKNKDD